jgi:hypothetical protein
MILRKKARNEDLRVDYFQKSTPMNHHPRRSKMLTSKAQGKVKARLTSEKHEWKMKVISDNT